MFNDVHLFAVVFSVIVINYIFQDGKSDYFQGMLYRYKFSCGEEYCRSNKLPLYFLHIVSLLNLITSVTDGWYLSFKIWIKS